MGTSEKRLGFVPLEGLPELSFPQQPSNQDVILRDDDCYALWDRYAMPENIRRHSRFVAHIAQILAELAIQKHAKISIADVRASALLHDLGKYYSLQYGGSHAQIGGAWVVAETRNYAIAQGVIHHVHWPWPIRDDVSICQLPLLVLYADKRVQHDEAVTVAGRYQDLQVRYGVNQEARASIKRSFTQIQAIEQALAKVLGWDDLDTYAFSCNDLSQTHTQAGSVRARPNA
ncbi:MAG: phosphohydrolase [Desulfovibrio sp.]|nr:phosphohydrolase [Desulfovibrio sp.]